MTGEMTMFGWEEIYCGFDAERFYKIKFTLENTGINIKTKTKDVMGNRMTRNSMAGANPFIANRAGMNPAAMVEYQIFVKKEDLLRAQEALSEK